MKITSLIAGSILVVLFASCSAAYKTDQTPDDVYYSPGKPVGDEAKQNNASQNDYSYNKEDDNYLRMMVQNRSRWSSIDDYAYWNSYNTTSYGLGLGNSNFCNNYWNNSYYNYNPYPSISFGYGYNNYPYYGYGNGFHNYYPSYGYNYGHSYYNPSVYIKKVSYNTGPRTSLGTYQNHTFSNQNFSNSNNNNHNFSNGNTPQTGVGRLLRTIVSGGSNSSDNYNPARTFSNSTKTNTYSPSLSPSSSSAPAAASRRTSSSSSSSSSGGATRRN